MTEKNISLRSTGHHQLPRAVVMDHDANIISVSQRASKSTQNGLGRTRPNKIFKPTLVEVLAKADISSDQIAAIGITTGIETLLSGEKSRRAYL